MVSPDFRAAVAGANRGLLARSVSDPTMRPLTDYWNFNAAGDPISLKNAGIPPVALDRINRQLGSMIGAAHDAGDWVKKGDLTSLKQGFQGMLDNAYPDTYPQARDDFAANSPGLAPFNPNVGTVSAVPDAVRRDSFGNFNGTPPSEIPDSFLRGSATKEKLDSLVSAYGGDRDAALSGLEQHLTGKLNAAVNPDGTLDQGAYDRALQPYQKALNGNAGLWFPSLMQKFGTAQAAQGTLDTLTAQRGIADSIMNGDLRDGNGAVTGASFGSWLKSNLPAINRVNPNSALRLQAIGQALATPQTDIADAVKSEALPVVAGLVTGGTEGAILGGMLHKTGQALFGAQDAKRQAAFASAMERATLDPDYAATLTAGLSQRTPYMSPRQALESAVFATAPAMNAATGVQPAPGQ
jgi:hypothetical protein